MHPDLLQSLRDTYHTELKVISSDGGEAAVYAANVRGFDRAIKVSKAPVHDLGRSEEQLKLLTCPAILECHSILRLYDQYVLHGHLVSIWDLGGCWENDFVETTLASRLATCKSAGHCGIPRDELEQYLRDVATAIDVVVQSGFLHRDVKPANLILVRGKARLGDFGITSFSGASTCATATRGTHGYLPPECYATKAGLGNINDTIDLYSLAVSAIQLTTGNHPFRSVDGLLPRHPDEDFLRRLREEPPDTTGLSDLQRAAVLKALHPDYKERRKAFKTATAFITAFYANPQAKVSELRASVPEHSVHLAEAASFLDTKAAAIACLFRGDVWHAQKEYDRAIAAYSEALFFDPDSYAAYFFRANAFAAQGAYDDAVTNYTLAIELDPKSYDAHLNCGDAYTALERYEDAEARYSSAIGIDGKSPIAYSSRGDARKELEKYAKAINDYDRAIELEPDSAKHHILRGHVWVDLEKYDEAIASYSKAICIDSTSAVAYRSRAESHSLLEEYEAAIEDYTHVSRLDLSCTSLCVDGCRDAHQAIALRLSESKQFDQSIEHWNEAIRIDPSDDFSFAERSKAWMSKQQYAQAEDDCNRAIDLSEFPEYYYRDRAKVRQFLNKHAEAIEDLSKLIQKGGLLMAGSDGADTFFLRGTSFHTLMKYAEAVSDYEKAIEKAPGRSDYHMKRGEICYYKLQKCDEAIKDFTIAIGITPESMSAYNLRGNVYWSQGMYAEAISDYTRAIELSPGDHRLHANRANALVKTGECGKAVADCDLSIQLEPKYALAYSIRGLARQGQETYALALSDFEEAARLDPRSTVYIDQIKKAKNRLAKDARLRGIQRHRQCQYSEAIAEFSEAIRLCPDSDSAYNCRGLVWHARKKYDDAISDFNSADDLSPRNAAYLINRANSRLKLNDIDNAMVDYENAKGYPWRPISLSSNAYIRLGQALYDGERFLEAIEQFTMAIRVCPDSSTPYNWRGCSHFAISEYGQAFADFTVAARIDPKCSVIQKNLANATEKMSDASAEEAAQPGLGVKITRFLFGSPAEYR